MLAATVFMSTSCSDDEDPTPENEEELITTVRLHFMPQGGGSMIMATYKDLDGDGGQAPTIIGATLAANKVYNLEVELLDESKSPAANITAEVEEEGDEHQLFFVPSAGLNLTVVATDKDSKNLPIGITSSVTTTTGPSPAGSTLRVVLKHQPGTKNGSINTGDTDVEVSFPITIQ